MRAGIALPLRLGVAAQPGLLPGKVGGDPAGCAIGRAGNEQRPKITVWAVKEPLGIPSGASCNAGNHTAVVEHQCAGVGPALKGPYGPAQFGTGDSLSARHRARHRVPPTVGNIRNGPSGMAQPRISGVGSPAVAARKSTYRPAGGPRRVAQGARRLRGQSGALEHGKGGPPEGRSNGGRRCNTEPNTVPPGAVPEAVQ